MGNAQDRETIGKEIEKKQISQVSFNFRNLTFEGKPLYKICQYCQICGKQRFTEQEVRELSDSYLSFDTFMEKYRKYRYCTGAICEAEDCNTKLYVLIGGFNCHMLHTSFDHKDIDAWLKKNPGENLHSN